MVAKERRAGGKVVLPRGVEGLAQGGPTAVPCTCLAPVRARTPPGDRGLTGAGRRQVEVDGPKHRHGTSLSEEGQRPQGASDPALGADVRREVPRDPVSGRGKHTPSYLFGSVPQSPSPTGRPGHTDTDKVRRSTAVDDQVRSGGTGTYLARHRSPHVTDSPNSNH